MNFSTVAPCRSSVARDTSKKRVITRRNASGSLCSPIAVDPVTSAKRIVTVLRTTG